MRSISASTASRSLVNSPLTISNVKNPVMETTSANEVSKIRVIRDDVPTKILP
jgi:hypothetical protein